MGNGVEGDDYTVGIQFADFTSPWWESHPEFDCGHGDAISLFLFLFFIFRSITKNIFSVTNFTFDPPPLEW